MMVVMDDWDIFLSAFGEENQAGGKEYTVGIEGNNCGCGIGSGGHFEGLVVFRRNCATI
ncbi:hypothetical protein Holit_01346 [Hollandina sp. SP2]